MRNFPFFPTEYGVSGVTLHEIPYRGNAYIIIQSVQDGCLHEHLEACMDFCRAAGAQRIYAANHPQLEQYPADAAVIQMRGTAWVQEGKTAQLFPVTQATASRWREIYNERMAAVDHAAMMDRMQEQNLAAGTGAYFIHQKGTLLGIGLMDDTKLEAMASVVPGAGETVLHTLMSLIEGEEMTLEVVSTNTRAISLYERMGFCRTQILRQWYRVAE